MLVQIFRKILKNQFSQSSGEPVFLQSTWVQIFRKVIEYPGTHFTQSTRVPIFSQSTE